MARKTIRTSTLPTWTMDMHACMYNSQLISNFTVNFHIDTYLGAIIVLTRIRVPATGVGCRASRHLEARRF